MKYPLDTAVAVMDAQASVLASLIAPITGCALIRQRIIYKAMAIPKPDADTGSYIFRSGMFIFSNGDGNPLTLASVPGILESLLVTSGWDAGYKVDDTNGDVEAFLTLVEDGIYTNQFADDIVQLEVAYLQSRS